MPGLDEILATIEAIYAAGLDGDLWPQALGAVTRTIGGAAATLEVYGRPTGLLEFHAHGVPPAHEVKYMAEFAPLNPRISFVRNCRPNELISDYMLIDEPSMRRDPFYADFLAPAGLRYCIGGVLSMNTTESVAFSVQRTVRQGHVQRNEMKLMAALLPHMRQAFDVTRRLRAGTDASRSFERALDWVPDGVALLSANGAVLYANEAFQALARRKDGIAVKKGRVELTSFEARDRLDRAIAQAIGVADGTTSSILDSDFPVARAAGAPPCFVSVRPLPSDERNRINGHRAVAILFVRDPAQRNVVSISALRETFGFTEAEALLAQAVQAGTTLGEYARDHAVSLNTVYTHLRRIREKTGCNRMPQLVARLNELKAPARVG